MAEEAKVCAHKDSEVERELSPLRNLPFDAFEMTLDQLFVVIADRRISELIFELEWWTSTEIEVLERLADEDSPSVVSKTAVDITALLVRMGGRASSVSSKTLEHMTFLY